MSYLAADMKIGRKNRKIGIAALTITFFAYCDRSPFISRANYVGIETAHEDERITHDR